MLEWSRENYGPMNWEDAIEFCANLDEGGHRDWRLPTLQELTPLIDCSKSNPATEVPNLIPAYYWSSTTDDYDTDFAWGVHFGLGYDGWNCKSSNYSVRAVQGENG